MKTFKDNAGREWTLTINVSAIKRVRSLIDIDLMQVVEGQLLQRLAADPVLLCDTIYCLCKPDAEKQGITDAQFGEAMAGDAIDGATTAVLEELADFFPQARRKLLRKALDKLTTLESIAVDTLEQELESGTLEQQMREALTQVLRGMDGDSSTNSQASSASTPAR